ncbi:MAG: tetratricopeptide repeat protein [Elusimicrobia bacterium]|nr:tetratricopeptide repeat protein [Elusimicrobiota bacterium]
MAKTDNLNNFSHDDHFKQHISDRINIFLAGLLLFFIPLIPDEKITRWKLWVLESGLFVIFIIWLFGRIKLSTIYIRNSILNKPIFIWTIFIFFMYAISKSSHIAELEMFRIIVCFVSFFTFSNIALKQEQREVLINFWIMGGCLAALYGILTHFGGFWIIKTPQVDRVFSTFGNPIFFAAFLIVTIPFLIYKIILSRGFLIKFLWLFFMVPFLIALYFTKCRAAWIGFGISCIILILNVLKSRIHKIIFILIFIIVSVSFVYKTKDTWLRHQGHLLIWRDSMRMVLAKPVLGVGIGAFIINFPNYASDELKKIWPLNQNIVNDAHSEFVQLLTETGLVGFGLFLWIIIVFFMQSRKFHNSISSKSGFLLQTAGTASVCAILIQNMFSVDMRFTISSFYLFMIFGIASSYSNNYGIKIRKDYKIILLLVLVASISFLEYRMVIKQYKSWKVVFESEDFMDKKIIDSNQQKEIIEKMIAATPSDARLYFKLGYIWANEIKPNKGSSQINRVAVQKAVENFSRAVQINPAVENGGAYNNLGNIYFTINNRAKAKENYIKAIEINPELIDAHLNLGLAYYYEGKLQKSAVEFESVLKLDPKNSSAIYMLKKMRE